MHILLYANHSIADAFVTISRASYSVLEGSTASVSIDLTGVLDRSISLAFATENITAQGDHTVHRYSI